MGTTSSGTSIAPVQARQLADREPVRDGDRSPADEALPALLAQRPVEVEPAARVGPVEHDHGQADLCAARHGLAQRRDVGVAARADVLQVDQQHVEAGQRRRIGPALGAVERDHRQPGGAVARVVDRVARGHVAADAVLGREQAHQPDALVGRQPVHAGHEPSVDAGRVREQAQALAAHELDALVEQHVDPQARRLLRGRGERGAQGEEELHRGRTLTR
jgi:hypothetical protein